MSWRKPTEDDIIAKLSQEEINLYRRSAKWTSDPIAVLMRSTVDTFRGFIRSGKKCRMCPDAETLPQMLIGPAMDYLAFDILKRANSNVSDDRAEARKSAERLLEKIAEGAISPEDYGEEAATESKIAATPGFSQPTPERLLD